MRNAKDAVGSNAYDPTEYEPDDAVRIPVSQALVDDLALPRELCKSTIVSSRANLVEVSSSRPEFNDEFATSAEMYVSANGGSLRWFDGAQAHETGWFPSKKRGRLLHWEGITQYHILQRAECDWNVLWAQSESRMFRFLLDGRWREYTCDVEIQYADGSVQIVEAKADERSLRDPDYRLVLAGVSEICRRVGFGFTIIMGDEVFKNRDHRRNVELFASRRFATIRPEHIRALEAFAIRHGSQAHVGDVSSILEPTSSVVGRALVPALTVQRRLEIDLTSRITNHSLVRIH